MIFTGNTADGNAFVAKGMYLSLDGSWWSSKPITREQKAYDMVFEHCHRYRKSFRELFDQIKCGSRENLPKWVRVWFMDKMNESMLEEIKVKLFEVGNIK